MRSSLESYEYVIECLTFAVPKLVVSDCSLGLLMSPSGVHSSLCLSHEVYYPASFPIVTRGISFACPSRGVVTAHPIDGTQPRTRTQSMRTCANLPKSIFQRCATKGGARHLTCMREVVRLGHRWTAKGIDAKGGITLVWDSLSKKGREETGRKY